MIPEPNALLDDLQARNAVLAQVKQEEADKLRALQRERRQSRKRK